MITALTVSIRNAWHCALSRRNALALAIVLAVLGFRPAHAGTVYDLKNDWNPPANPNGVWSYNAGSVPLPYQAYADWLTGPAYSLNPNQSSLEVAPAWFREESTSQPPNAV